VETASPKRHKYTSPPAEPAEYQHTRVANTSESEADRNMRALKQGETLQLRRFCELDPKKKVMTTLMWKNSTPDRYSGLEGWASIVPVSTADADACDTPSSTCSMSDKTENRLPLRA
jgi:hypothetical protein